MASIKFSVKATSEQEWKDICKWGFENGYKYFKYNLPNYSPSNNVLRFWSDGDMCTDNDSGAYYTLTFEEFKNQYMDKDIKKETFEVDKEFILEAFQVACEEWKQKIVEKFPTVFNNPFTGAERGDRFTHNEFGECILAQIDKNRWALINLNDGNRVYDPAFNIQDVAQQYFREWIKVKNNEKS